MLLLCSIISGCPHRYVSVSSPVSPHSSTYFLNKSSTRPRSPFQLTSGHQLDEELDFVLVRRRHDRIGALASLVRTLHAERGVLARPELEFAAGIDPNAPKIGRKINSSGDPAAVKLVVGAHLMAA